MTSKKHSNMLPPLPQSLKSISSYIQRAEELRDKDPVMAYWCTYYAAQLGLDLKSHEIGARDYLFALITLLEGMKKELEGNDAVEHEAAGAAYVENFALKVFTLADNEDRRGEASRSTAKKFLAAANFLELLRVFEKSNNAEVNEEKVRYAKWKASEIAKAFREGRQPTPGSARIGEGISVVSGTAGSTPTARTPDRSPVAPPAGLPGAGPPSAQRTPPFAPKQLPGSIGVPLNSVSHSDAWSTLATPGSEAVGPVQPTYVPERQDNIDQGRIDPSTRKVHFSPSVVGGLSSTDGSPPPSPNARLRDVFISAPYPSHEPLAQSPDDRLASTSSFGRPDPSMMPLPDSSPSTSSRTSPEGSPPQDFRKTSGRSRSGSSPRMDSVTKLGSSSLGVGGVARGSPPCSGRLSLQPSAPPLPSIPSSAIGTHDRRPSGSNRNSPSGSSNLPLHPVYSSPQPPNNSIFSGSPDLTATSGLPLVSMSNPVSSPYAASHTPKQPSPPAQYANIPPPPVELTPALITKAQKCCRFAISALEYEDAEQARKELRTALALLGDR